jgi:dimethylaniline monooxygenase (N-oxide forming)
MTNLFFLGLVQPLCAIMPIAEVQAKWLASLLSGEYALPTATELRRKTADDYRRALSGYLKTTRHTIQVRDCAIYSYGVRCELKRGRRRALKRGNIPEIAARAHEIPNPEPLTS